MKRKSLKPWEARPFGLFLLKELLRHLEDCRGICLDLKNLDEIWPGSVDPALAAWALELSTVLSEIQERIPGGCERHRVWIEV